MDKDWQFYCRKQVNQARGVCRKAHRPERFGTHKEQCEVSCRAHLMAADLDLRLRAAAIRTVEQRGKDDQDWRTQATGFWKVFETSAGACDSAGVHKAHDACNTLCADEFSRRDIKELQAMTRGEALLPVVQPSFACSPSPALEQFSTPDDALIKQLFPPGHARRSDKQ